MRNSIRALLLLLTADWRALSQPSPTQHSHEATTRVIDPSASSVGQCQLQTLSERRLDVAVLKAVEPENQTVLKAVEPETRTVEHAARDASSLLSVATAEDGLAYTLDELKAVENAKPDATTEAATAENVAGATATTSAGSGKATGGKMRREGVAMGLIMVLVLVLWLSCRGGASSDGNACLITDAMTYRTEGLATWDVFFGYSLTVWDNPSLWNMGRRLALLTFAVAMIELLLASDPSSLDPLRFSQIGVVLHVFAALLLGFFLTSSVNRWFTCVDGFLDLINAIRNLQMQLQSLGVSQERSDKACRLGVLSAWGLNYEMKRKTLHPSEAAEALETMWSELEARDKPLSRLLPEERALLEGVDDFPGLVWVWVGSLVGRMAQDGDIPPMTSPTYGRIIDLAQQAQAGMRQVRSSIAVQMPFAYVHTLATIVHLNNILSAVSFGLTLGASIGSILVHIDPRLHLWNSKPHPGHFLIQDIQSILIQFFQCYVAPIVYLAFFEIGLLLASPFANEDAAIPVERLLEKLESDLQDGSRLAADPPLWERPSFKAKAMWAKASSSETLAKLRESTARSPRPVVDSDSGAALVAEPVAGARRKAAVAKEASGGGAAAQQR